MIYTTSKLPKGISLSYLDDVINHATEHLVELEDLGYVHLSFRKLKEPYVGFCDYDEEVVITVHSGLSVYELTRTIFHELVHVKQHLEGRLIYGNPTRWDDIPFDEPYMELPWEVEAYKLEQELMDSFALNMEAT